MSDAISIIKERTSANNFDPTHHMSQAEIEELVQLSINTPTSFNMQNWRLIAVSSQEKKAQLKALAFNQPKVGDAAVTFIVVGNAMGYKDLPHVIKPMLDAGAIDQAAYDGWIGMANGMYDNNTQLQRDEAIRSGALASMTLMYAAQAKGLVSGAMIGFDAPGVAKAFHLGEHEVPVMLIAVGKAAAGNWPRKARRALSEVLSTL
jgi:nitroreductase